MLRANNIFHKECSSRATLFYFKHATSPPTKSHNTWKKHVNGNNGVVVFVALNYSTTDTMERKRGNKVNAYLK